VLLRRYNFVCIHFVSILVCRSCVDVELLSCWDVVAVLLLLLFVYCVHYDISFIVDVGLFFLLFGFAAHYQFLTFLIVGIVVVVELFTLCCCCVVLLMSLLFLLLFCCFIVGCCFSVA